MHRVTVVLFVVLSFARPAFAADDLASREDDVKQRMAASSASVTQLDQRIVALQRSIADTQQRSERERAQLHVLARVLYAQPDSVVGTLAESTSLSDALTRMGDVASAAQQASRTRWALNRDLASLSTERSQLETDRSHQLELKKQLESEFNSLVQLQAARDAQLQQQAAAAPVARAAAPAPAPAAPVASGAGGDIQQIILNAFAPLGGGAQQWALRVARCESNYNPNAVNRYSGASGLFQFLPSTWRATPQGAAGSSVFDPVANAQAAAWLYQRSGPGQWSCS